MKANIRKLLWYILITNILGLQASDWDDFVCEIQDSITKTTSYTLKTNNDEYFTLPTKTEEFIEYGTFDFIIIGGGTAGGVLASRLTEESFTVLVIEAGQKGPKWSSILGLSSFFGFTDYNWGYNTTYQKHACFGSPNQQCFYPRGKVLGGGSVINAGMYIRGNALDYDTWENMGGSGWAYEDCLPYFKKSEAAEFTTVMDREYHGFNGFQKINVPNGTLEITTPLIEAFNELGKEKGDYNGKSQDCVSKVQFYLDGNIRSSTDYSFLEKAENRTNLNITLNSLVTKIRIDSNKKANGVEFVKDGKQYYAHARKEVLLSAGAINSPQILMLSGIGPASHLETHDIKVIEDLPVGKNLLDHMIFPGIFFRTKDIFYNTTLLENLNLWKENKRPLVAGVQAEIITFLNFDGPSNSQPEVEILGIRGSSQLATAFLYNDEYKEAFNEINELTDVSTVILLLHPYSTGTVKLKTSNPRDYPLIDTNYLSDPRDVEFFHKGVKTLLKLNDTNAFQNRNWTFNTVSFPNCEDKYEKITDDWWICGIRSISGSIYHPIGTTRMGVNLNDSVVDTELKVHGIKSLRVVDAGVMPSHISGHTNAAVVMIAEKISDAIKAEYM